MVLSSQDINKLAGLMEGEGSFYTNHGSPCIQIGMGDRDVIAWVSKLWKGNINGPYKAVGIGKYPARKPTYRTFRWGADAVGWMMTIYGLMGKRRKMQIRKVLKVWRAKPLTGTYAYHVGDRIRPQCHPERKHYADGQCHPCYNKERLA